MKRCETCLHFQTQYGWEGKNDGNCNRLGSNQYLIFDSKQNQFISFNNDKNPISVHVGKNFGCVLHKAIEIDEA